MLLVFLLEDELWVLKRIFRTQTAFSTQKEYITIIMVIIFLWGKYIIYAFFVHHDLTFLVVKPLLATFMSVCVSTVSLQTVFITSFCYMRKHTYVVNTDILMSGVTSFCNRSYKRCKTWKILYFYVFIDQRYNIAVR